MTDPPSNAPPTASAPNPATRIRHTALATCQEVFSSWRGTTVDDFEFADPKGFSSFTMAIRADDRSLEPAAVLYRHLDGKENAILDFDAEKRVFLLLGEHHIAAHCHHYGDDCRIEEFYDGRTLTAPDVFDPTIQQGIADELWRFHHLDARPPDTTGLPDATFFDLLHEKWGAMAAKILTERRHEFPADEQHLCDDLAGLGDIPGVPAIFDDDTIEKVRRCLPDSDPVFCHNDTYHGNVMQLRDGTIKLLDFEFSCLNHIAFDFANLFAETVMEHGLADPPHFRINEPRFDDTDLASLIGFYLDNDPRFHASAASEAPEAPEAPEASLASLASEACEAETARLVAETRRAILLSDYMYAMAALPLALEPIQKIRFLPYSHQRFLRFLTSWHAEFPAG
jgi:Choline/ethanolamine kinase